MGRHAGTIPGRSRERSPGGRDQSKRDRKELVKITPTHVQVFDLRREDMLVASARERLVAQAMPGAAMTQERPPLVPADTMARLLAAFRAWRRSPSVVPAK
jgi:hypothetical protein